MCEQTYELANCSARGGRLREGMAVALLLACS